MKRIIKVLMVFLIVIFMTGCVKFNATMDIKKDKSMDFTVIYAVDKSMMGEEASNSILTDKQKKEAEKEGYTIEDYKEDNFVGVKLIKKIQNIDDVSTEKAEEYSLSGILDGDDDNKYIFQVKKGFFKNTYTANFKFDSSDSGLNSSDETDDYTYEEEDEDDDTKYRESDELDYASMMSSMDLSFNVNLPYGANSNNATKAQDDNKKLSWSLTATDEENIEFTFDIYNMIPLIGCGVAGVLLVLGILGAIIRKITGGNKNKPISQPVIEQNMEASDPQQVMINPSQGQPEPQTEEPQITQTFSVSEEPTLEPLDDAKTPKVQQPQLTPFEVPPVIESNAPVQGTNTNTTSNAFDLPPVVERIETSVEEVNNNE